MNRTTSADDHTQDAPGRGYTFGLPDFARFVLPRGRSLSTEDVLSGGASSGDAELSACFLDQPGELSVSISVPIADSLASVVLRIVPQTVSETSTQDFHIEEGDPLSVVEPLVGLGTKADDEAEDREVFAAERCTDERDAVPMAVVEAGDDTLCGVCGASEVIERCTAEADSGGLENLVVDIATSGKFSTGFCRLYNEEVTLGCEEALGLTLMTDVAAVVEASDAGESLRRAADWDDDGRSSVHGGLSEPQFPLRRATLEEVFVASQSSEAALNRDRWQTETNAWFATAFGINAAVLGRIYSRFVLCHIRQCPFAGVPREAFLRSIKLCDALLLDMHRAPLHASSVPPPIRLRSWVHVLMDLEFHKYGVLLWSDVLEIVRRNRQIELDLAAPLSHQLVDQGRTPPATLASISLASPPPDKPPKQRVTLRVQLADGMQQVGSWPHGSGADFEELQEMLRVEASKILGL